MVSFVLALIIGNIIGFLIIWNSARKLDAVKPKKEANDYAAKCTITHRSDIKTGSHITKEKIK